jgi:hypothetical protein
MMRSVLTLLLIFNVVKITFSIPVPSGEDEIQPAPTELSPAQLSEVPAGSHPPARPPPSFQLTRIGNIAAKEATSSNTRKPKQRTAGATTENDGIHTYKIDNFALSSRQKIDHDQVAVIDARKHHPSQVHATQQRYHEQFRNGKMVVDQLHKSIAKAQADRDALKMISQKHVVRLVGTSKTRMVAHHRDMQGKEAIEHDEQDLVFEHHDTGLKGEKAFRLDPTERMKEHLAGKKVPPLTEK